MTENDVDKIASAVCSKIQEHRQSWWVEPETHYNQHKQLGELLDEYKEAKNIFWKSFIGVLITGSLVITAVGFSVVNLGRYFIK